MENARSPASTGRSCQTVKQNLRNWVYRAIIVALILFTHFSLSRELKEVRKRHWDLDREITHLANKVDQLKDQSDKFHQEFIRRIHITLPSESMQAEQQTHDSSTGSALVNPPNSSFEEPNIPYHLLDDEEFQNLVIQNAAPQDRELLKGFYENQNEYKASLSETELQALEFATETEYAKILNLLGDLKLSTGMRDALRRAAESSAIMQMKVNDADLIKQVEEAREDWRRRREEMIEEQSRPLTQEERRMQEALRMLEEAARE